MSDMSGNGMIPPVDIDEMNGRIIELSELNAALTQRCAGMRGQMAKKDREIVKLTQEVTRYRQRWEAESHPAQAMENLEARN